MKLSTSNSPQGREIFARYLYLAEEKPNEFALIFEREPFVGVRRTWAQLMQRCEDLEKCLRAAGTVAGTRCAVTLADNPDTLPLLLALWKLDATAVLIDNAWGSSLRERVVDHGKATISAGFKKSVEISSITRRSTVDPEPLPEGTGILGYTSGSTGDPKGVPFTHFKLALTMQAAAAAIVAYRGNAPRRIACSMRLSGSGVLNLHYTWAAFSDATVVVLPELTMQTASSYWSRIESNDIEQTFLVPALIDLVNHMAAPRTASACPPACLTGSSPLSPRTQKRFQERFGIPLLNAYGLSETMCASFFGHCALDGWGTNSVGRPWLLQARLRDAQQSIVSAEGEGELELSGPTIFDGYYGNPTATAAAFDGRWFRTGDVARRDGSGVYTLVGRIKDVVMKGGYSIYLNEVEESALAANGVLEAAAVPVSIVGGGEDIGLLVRIDPLVSTSENDVLTFVRTDLGLQRSPYRVVTITDHLPRTGQDKLDRKKILSLWKSTLGLTSHIVPGLVAVNEG